MSESTLPISEDLLNILRCPLAIQENKGQEDPGKLELVHNSWLVCHENNMKYPIRDGIPVMLIDEGKKWKNTSIDTLPVPPPSQ
ncbi:MAG: Trm112 family protein [Chloroflexota bacterium]